KPFDILTAVSVHNDVNIFLPRIHPASGPEAAHDLRQLGEGDVVSSPGGDRVVGHGPDRRQCGSLASVASLDHVCADCGCSCGCQRPGHILL
ncbi:hypothetical protein BG000_004560, partial [Podila horticola]